MLHTHGSEIVPGLRAMLMSVSIRDGGEPGGEGVGWVGEGVGGRELSIGARTLTQHVRDAPGDSSGLDQSMDHLRRMMKIM